MRRSILLVAILLFAGPSVSAQFGSLKKAFDRAKDFSDLEISGEEERLLGERISQRIREVYGVQQDEAQSRYVALVGKVVAQRSGRPNLDYQFIILDSDSTNAFAAPGGFIHITRGALALMGSEAELAGVLAHEISHVTERHTIKGLQKSKGIKLANDQTSLTGDSAVFDKVVEKATEAVMQGFGRSEELEADEEGLEIASKCRYHAEGLVSFLKSLQSRYSQRKSRAGLFASHPESEERIKKLQSRISKKKLVRDDSVLLADRYTGQIKYQLTAFAGTGSAVEGAKGMAGDSAGKGTEADKKEEKKGGLLSRMKNPFGSGKKQERAEVTGSAAARGVETELGTEAPGNPALVAVTVSTEEIRAFKQAGGLS